MTNHNKPDFNEQDWENDFHNHIDRERTQNNIILKQEQVRDAYDRIFGNALEKYNDKQRREDRKIDDYYDHMKQSKTLHTQYEFIVQIDKIEDFEDNPGDWETANQILTEHVEEFQEHNPKFESYNTVIHIKVGMNQIEDHRDYKEMKQVVDMSRNDREEVLKKDKKS